MSDIDLARAERRVGGLHVIFLAMSSEIDRDDIRCEKAHKWRMHHGIELVETLISIWLTLTSPR